MVVADIHPSCSLSVRLQLYSVMLNGVLKEGNCLVNKPQRSYGYVKSMILVKDLQDLGGVQGVSDTVCS